jgi:uncharacterized protein (TIGR02598 family)
MKTGASRIKAFSLVEVALALGLAGFCLTAVLGLLPVGLNSNMASNSQTVATGIVAGVGADLRSTPITSGTTQLYGIRIPSNPVSASSVGASLYFTGDGQASTSLTSQARYRLTVTFLPNVLPNNGSSAKTATFATLVVSWPAMATPANAAGSVQTFVAVDRH